MRVVAIALALFASSALYSIVEASERSIRFERSEALFARRVAPMLQDKCFACHGGDRGESEGGLDLTSLETLAEGGDSGEPGVVSGAPDLSPIFLAAARTDDGFAPMPPKEAEKLTEEQLAWLRDWIELGTAWPSKARQEEINQQYSDEWSAEDGVTVRTSGGLESAWTNRKYVSADLWAYQPVLRFEIPDHEDRNPIDLILEAAWPTGLTPASPASRRELLRRATFDLTGLPPTFEEVEAFVADQRPDATAFADVVDRLLDSPHYGERMAQHWLDVVRYADSSGFANDFERGNAWRYRDYVVRSFNQDKPYDKFVREQIAGDEIAPHDPEGAIAVGYLRMGPWELTAMEVARIARQRFLDDVTNSVGETFLGHSLQCARCHDHKFDPVPARDYYRIQAVFLTTQLAERSAEFLNSENTSDFEEKRFLLRKQAAYRQAQAELQEKLLQNAETWFSNRLNVAVGEEAAGIQSRRQEWEQAVAKAQLNGQVAPFDDVRNDFRRRGIPESEFPPRFVGFSPHEFGISRVANKGLQRLRWELERYEPYALSVYNGLTPQLTSVNAPRRIPAQRTRGDLDAMCIRPGGDPFAEGEPVTPGTLSVLDDLVSADIPTTVDCRRRAFAAWVADARNPLTTRVIVNRIWQWHFGRGIAGNPNNFGATGERPTYPRLLDHLAATFVDEGWSIKLLHRRIMLSDAYRRSTSHPSPELLVDLDPQRTSLAAFHPRRLSAEELRDSMLAATGELNPSLGGIPCRPEINFEAAMQPRQVMGTFASAWTPNPLPEQRHRRSLYVLKLRGLIPPFFEVFNSPPPDFSCERRESSTVTPQVFSLFNSHDSYSRSLALANRAWEETSEVEVESRNAAAVERCFELALCRTPTPQEAGQVLAHWEALEARLPEVARPDRPRPVAIEREAIEENTGERFKFTEPLFAYEAFVSDLCPEEVDRHVRALGDVCLVLLNSNEFAYVY